MTPPKAPANATAFNHQGLYVDVSWLGSPSTDVTTYEVWRETNGATAIRLATLKTDVFWRDQAVQQGFTYTYKVVARDSLGNVSKPALTKPLTFRDSTPPRAVRNIRAFYQNGGVLVAWEPVVAADLASYRVLRAVSLATGEYKEIGLVDEFPRPRRHPQIFL